MQDITTYSKRLYILYLDKENNPLINGKPIENLNHMKKFIRASTQGGTHETTIAIYYQIFLIFSKWCDKPISTLTDDDIYDFIDTLDAHTYMKKGKPCHYSNETKLTYKRILKKFFTFSDFPELGAVCKQKAQPIEEKDKKGLLTKEEIELLISTAQHPKDKAIIATLYESGARRGELLSCNIEDVIFDSMGCKITFPKSKTKKRTLRLVYASSYLRNWIENHPIKLGNGMPDQSAPLWTTSNIYMGEFNRLSEMALYVQLRKIAEKAGIKKRVNPHSFRHARATDLSEHLTESQLKKHFGWSQGSNMAARYVHDPDTENAILKTYGIEIEDTHIDGMTVGKCPRCKELNPVKALYCIKCGMPLQGDGEGDLRLYF